MDMQGKGPHSEEKKNTNEEESTGGELKSSWEVVQERLKKMAGRKEEPEGEEEQAPSGPGSGQPDPKEETASSDEVRALREERDRLKDRLARAMADFSNYQKRVERDKAQWSADALRDFLHDLLPSLDDLERVIDSAEAAEDAPVILEGAKLVLNQFRLTLKKAGVEPIESVGEPVDLNLHEIVAQQPTPEGKEPGTVLEEIRTGYRIGDRTLRPARVIVGALPPPDTEAESSAEEPSGE